MAHILQLSIKNFRGLQDFRCTFGDSKTVCLIGRGDSGKTTILDAIFDCIRRSRFVVSDITGQRGGVYYEAGFASGLGLPVIQSCKKDDFSKRHFDVLTINTIVYDAPSELAEQLVSRVRGTIG